MKWLNYHHLYYFWKIAEHGSIAQASIELRVTQSSLSNQLKQLEDNFGFLLFDRVGKRIEISDRGRYVLAIANDIFTKGNTLVSEVRNNQLGVNRSLIRVGAVSTLSKNIQQVFLSPLLDITNKDRPELKLYSANKRSLLKKMKNFEVDFMITNSLSDLDLNGFISHKICSFPYCFVQKNDRSPKKLRERILEKGLITPLLEGDLSVHLDIFLTKNSLERESVFASVEDTALLRLFAVNEGCVVLIPKIGVYRDLLDRSIKVLGNLAHMKETFYLVSRPETYELLNLDALIIRFKEIFQRGNYE